MGNAIALGFFDGVHRGHAALFERTVAEAKRSGHMACAMTFDTHPDSLILGYSQPLLNTADERGHIMKNLHGIERILTVPFDGRLMHMPWGSFVVDVLVRDYDAEYLVAGHDFHFGYRGEGNPSRLSDLCGSLGVGCAIVPEVTIDDITVSSTYIRRLVAQGDMERAALFLGHPHFISGTVGRGRGLGRELGAPTVNIPLSCGIQAPAHGVYITRVCVHGELWPSVTNVGVCPTVSDVGELVAETTLLDFSGDLYGQKIYVEFLKFLRPETRFESISHLREQIGRDIESAKKHFL